MKQTEPGKSIKSTDLPVPCPKLPLARPLDKTKKPTPGAQQLLFGAYLGAGAPEISVFQIGPLEPDLYAIPEVQEALNDCLGLISEELNKP